MKILRVSELEAGKMYKFVEVNNEFRFLELNIMCEKHSQMVNAGEKATAAGVITLYGSCVQAWASVRMQMPGVGWRKL